MAKKLVSLSEFSRIAGVTRGAVTQAAVSSLKAAVTGKRVDIEHPDAVAYVQKQAAPTLYDVVLHFVSESRTASVRAITQEFNLPQREVMALLKQMEEAGAIGRVPKPGSKRQIFVKDVPKPAGRVPMVPATPAPKKPPAKAPTPENDLPTYEPDQDLGPLRDMTLSQLLTTFGTSERFSKWLGSAKTLEEIEARQVKNAKAKGELISRDLVRIHIFGMIDNSHKRLLTDEPRTLARRMRALAKSGATLEEMEQAIRESLSKQLRNVKATATRVLKK